jgi:RNA polymerase sigma-70 factor (ECF subfamily)
MQFSATDEPSREAEEHYRRELFQVAARAIEPEFTGSTWLAFWRTAVEAGEIAAVAKELGLTPGAVYIARSRVLARLRRRVEEIEGRD